MRTVNGGARGDDNLRAYIKRIEDKIDLLSRRISRIPKIPEQSAASGVYGQTIAVPTETVSIGTGGSLTVSSWTFLNEGPTGTSPTLTTDPSFNPNSFCPTEPGWYEALILVDMGWTSANAPDHVRVSAGRAAAGYLSAQFQFEIPTLLGDGSGLHSTSRKGCFVTMATGPQYYNGDQVFAVSVTWPNTNTPTKATGSGTPQFRVDFTRVG